MFRLLMGVLLKVVPKKVFIQNYLDFRYYRRFFVLENAAWLPGSGAYIRQTSCDDGYFTVTRSDKISTQLRDLERFSEDFQQQLTCIGLDQSDASLGCDIRCVGKVPQNDVFSFGNTFVWLGGYGDGLPHSLCEALYNRVVVLIRRRQFIEFGLYKLGAEFSHSRADWLRITNVHSEKLNSERIANETFRGVSRFD
jgi:hypothetical protein